MFAVFKCGLGLPFMLGQRHFASLSGQQCDCPNSHFASVQLVLLVDADKEPQAYEYDQATKTNQVADIA